MIIPNGTKKIGNNVFDNSLLENIEIPNSIEEIGDSFNQCKSLNYNILNFCKYLGNDNNPYLVLVSTIDKNVENITVNDQTKIIADNAFENCVLLKKAFLPNDVNYLGKRAFFNCKSLNEINIPNNISKINSFTFMYCSSLKNITLNSNIKIIEEYAFSDCNSLESISLSEDLKEIGNYAFFNNYSLNEIQLNKNVEIIGDYAFDGCVSVTIFCKGLIEQPENWSNSWAPNYCNIIWDK